jgi:hypothetical protein
LVSELRENLLLYSSNLLLGFSNWPVIYYIFPRQLGTKVFCRRCRVLKKILSHHHHRAINGDEKALPHREQTCCHPSVSLYLHHFQQSPTTLSSKEKRVIVASVIDLQDHGLRVASRVVAIVASSGICSMLVLPPITCTATLPPTHVYSLVVKLGPRRAPPPGLLVADIDNTTR